MPATAFAVLELARQRQDEISRRVRLGRVAVATRGRPRRWRRV